MPYMADSALFPDSINGARNAGLDVLESDVTDSEDSDSDVAEITAASFRRSGSRTTLTKRIPCARSSLIQMHPDLDDSFLRDFSPRCSSIESYEEFQGQLEPGSDQTAPPAINHVNHLEDPIPGQEHSHVSSLQEHCQDPRSCIYPRSRFDEDLSSSEAVPEKEAVLECLRAIRSNAQHANGKNATFDGHDFIQLELHDFWIYNSPQLTHHAWELRGLQTVPSEKAGNATRSWYLDGTLRLNGKTRYIRQVPFRVVSIGGYGEDLDTVGDQVWVQSNQNKGSDVFYQLKQPSNGYQRFHDGFLWTANLAKYFVDFAQACLEQAKDVSIRDFKSEFSTWMGQTYGESGSFQQWFTAHKSTDFRTTIVANKTFLHKEAIGVDSDLEQHTIWREIYTIEKGYGVIPKQPLKQLSTIVTPYVFDCFSHLQFGQHLKAVKPSVKAESSRRATGKDLHLTVDQATITSQKDLLLGATIVQTTGLPRHKEVVSLTEDVDTASIGIGDVLGILKDGEDSKWRDEESRWKKHDDCWFVYVQTIITDARGRRSFGVLWLYRPSDTTCALMKYPYENELFLSEHCNCDYLVKSPITEDQIICKVSVDWGFGPKDSKLQHFIRQTYTIDNAFVTFDRRHRKCIHLRKDSQAALLTFAKRYRVGDTVLVEPPAVLRSSHSLEVAEILRIVQAFDGCATHLRRLRRRQDLREDNLTPRPNELVYTEETFVVASSKIHRKCLVRFYRSQIIEGKQVPPPYNRDGTGDAFYIRRQQGTSVLAESSMNTGPVHESLIQGFDPLEATSHQKLRGMDLYCGGGNFGRGLEEGSAVHNEWAVDLDINAIHTYSANLPKADSTKLFYGSVNDLLYQAMTGNSTKSPLIPMPGEVDFVSAGSPCPGFSLLNCYKTATKGLQNQSLVASVAAYVDFYRPKYAILENVVTMAQRGKGRSEDVLSQLVCCLVGMGYQVQIFNLDAWSFGSPQTRSRLFVAITAPGLIPIPHPGLSHSHPNDTTDRSLGKMANGQAFGERQFDRTPFKYVTALEATKDLPDIGDAQTYHCIAYPDHVPSKCVLPLLRSQMQVIPMLPLGMNFMKAWNGGKGILTAAQRDLFPRYNKKGSLRQSVMEGSRGWQRLHPDQLFPTISTAIGPECARSGRCLHWSQQRLMTVMEARRAQSFPDDEVILGIPTKQWKIVGNSVARTVALALGLALRAAWLQSPDSKGTSEAVTSSQLRDNSSLVSHDSTRYRYSHSVQGDDDIRQMTMPYSPMDEDADTYSLNSMSLITSSSMPMDARCQRPVTPASSTCPELTPPSKRFLQDSSQFTSRKKQQSWGPASVRNPASLWTPSSDLSRASSPTCSVLNQESRRRLVFQETLDNIQSDEIRHKHGGLSVEQTLSDNGNRRTSVREIVVSPSALPQDSERGASMMIRKSRPIEVIDLLSDTSDTDVETADESIINEQGNQRYHTSS